MLKMLSKYLDCGVLHVMTKRINGLVIQKFHVRKGTEPTQSSYILIPKTNGVFVIACIPGIHIPKRHCAGIG